MSHLARGRTGFMGIDSKAIAARRPQTGVNVFGPVLEVVQ